MVLVSAIWLEKGGSTVKIYNIPLPPFKGGI
jgi:hypothetical protein